MTDKILFRGGASALVTPFRSGEIDFNSLKKIISTQIASGIDALVVGGTTGEASTLSDEEKLRLYDFVISEVGGRIPVIVGCGTNCTERATAFARAIKGLSADGILSVTPYYNKGTKEGIKRHYLSIAETADLPTIIYNVPQRTGVNLPISLIEELANHENIVGIKEASDSVERLAVLSAMSDKISLYAGNDSMTLPALSLGGLGVISVVSNVLPLAMHRLCESFFNQDIDEARKIQHSLVPMIKALFCEVNPVPIKYCMSLVGLCTPELRLPLSTPDSAIARVVEEAYERYKQDYPELS